MILRFRIRILRGFSLCIVLEVGVAAFEGRLGDLAGDTCVNYFQVLVLKGIFALMEGKLFPKLTDFQV